MTAIVNHAKAHSFKIEVTVLVAITTFLLTVAVAEFIIMFGS